MARDRSSVDETIDSTRSKPKGSAEKAPAARLRSAFPPDLAIAIDLGDERTVLGRQPAVDGSPPIQHPTVSRAHVAVEWDAELATHVARDLGSRNGATVDGRPLAGGWHPLEAGAILRLGDLLLVYERGHTLQQSDPPEVSRSAVFGESTAVRALRAQIARAAPDLSPVLILGETGTGKEQIAREVHRLSGRRGELVAINCATLGEQLIESQLFGHVKGAFTGAAGDHPGLFRAAEGGTLFLDEIGELPKPLQAKLLRAIQEREVMAVGSTKAVRVDVRVVAATHQDLAQKARGGEFRQDLYARLALWQVQVPPLRERRSDVMLWLDHLHRIWREERQLDSGRPLSIHVDAAEALIGCPWPENLRGLNRLVHEVAREKSAAPLRVEQLPPWVNALRAEAAR
jgi:DNA-binding NtrC family response regulator